MKNNRGSTVVEVTLIMPILLMMMVLFITMLLGVFQQAYVHSGLMYDSAEDESVDWDNPEIILSVQGDRKTFSRNVNIEFVQGYSISSDIRQTVRISGAEEKLRRWQVIGGMAAE